jgi:hypothetical protein
MSTHAQFFSHKNIKTYLSRPKKGTFGGLPGEALSSVKLKCCANHVMKYQFMRFDKIYCIRVSQISAIAICELSICEFSILFFWRQGSTSSQIAKSDILCPRRAIFLLQFCEFVDMQKHSPRRGRSPCHPILRLLTRNVAPDLAQDIILRRLTPPPAAITAAYVVSVIASAPVFVILHCLRGWRRHL